MTNKLKLPVSESDKQTLKLEGEVDPKDALVIARRIASIEKAKLRKNLNKNT